MDEIVKLKKKLTKELRKRGFADWQIRAFVWQKLTSIGINNPNFIKPLINNLDMELQGWEPVNE